MLNLKDKREKFEHGLVYHNNNMNLLRTSKRNEALERRD
jgi:hypothetical protein